MASTELSTSTFSSCAGPAPQLSHFVNSGTGQRAPQDWHSTIFIGRLLGPSTPRREPKPVRRRVVPRSDPRAPSDSSASSPLSPRKELSGWLPSRLVPHRYRPRMRPPSKVKVLEDRKAPIACKLALV